MKPQISGLLFFPSLLLFLSCDSPKGWNYMVCGCLTASPVNYTTEFSFSFSFSCCFFLSLSLSAIFVCSSYHPCDCVARDCRGIVDGSLVEGARVRLVDVFTDDGMYEALGAGCEENNVNLSHCFWAIIMQWRALSWGNNRFYYF